MNALEKFASMSGVVLNFTYILEKEKNQDESRLGSEASLKVRFRLTLHCTEMRFASFFSAIVVNPPE